ncbi:MAG: hypothetical protein P8N98_17660 [Paracoccaceae bacterium]|nr:hypothetical protein [Paracoccaceae bacterium]
MRAQLYSAILALPAIMLAGQGAAACDETILVEYQVYDGRYQIEVNDVYLDSGASQSTSGGIPINDWLLKGENSIRVLMNAQSGEFSVYAICNDGSGKRDFDDAALSGRSSADLTFDVPDPPQRLYLTATPSNDDGLLEAVETLKAVMTAQDFDAVWEGHTAMRSEMEMTGASVKSEAYQMEKIVANIAPKFAANLKTCSVLGGRVWEVFVDDFAPPISDVVSVNGGQVDFKTGSFWMKVDGTWSVYRK